MLKRLLLKLPDHWRQRLGFLRGYLFRPRRSASQYGEDLLIEAALESLGRYPKDGGTYVDVGAFHPRYQSNTWRLAKAGWRGVAIDFPAAKVNGFRIRKNCIPVACAIGASDGETTVYRQPILLSAIDSASREHLETYPGDFPIFEERVRVRSLQSLLSELKIADVDVLNIDIEGMDITALEGLGAIRPKIIVIEDATPFPNVNPGIADWMKGRGYQLYGRAGVTLLYCQILSAR